MNGIEKITGRIEADAQEQAKAIAAEAEARCAEIRADYDKQAQDQYWARVRDGVKACEDRVQRMGRLAEMEARKSVLALKQEMVDAAFAAALDKICTMPQADYVAYLAKLAAQAATTGTETLVFNAKDQAACGQAVVDAANALLAQQGKPRPAHHEPGHARPARRVCAPAGRYRGQLCRGDDRRALPQ